MTAHHPLENKAARPLSEFARTTAFIQRIPAQPLKRGSVANQFQDLAAFSKRAGLQASVLANLGGDSDEATPLQSHRFQELLKELPQQPDCIMVNYQVHLGLLLSLSAKLGLVDATEHLRTLA